MELFEVAGEKFYFDLDNISDFVRIDDDNNKSIDDILGENDPSEVENPELQGQLIDMTKWDMTKALIETVLNENGIVDEAMGVVKLGEQLSIPFRLSFNTLIKHKLIKRSN
jgi:hypothetical protein